MFCCQNEVLAVFEESGCMWDTLQYAAGPPVCVVHYGRTNRSTHTLLSLYVLRTQQLEVYYNYAYYIHPWWFTLFEAMYNLYLCTWYGT